MKGVVTKLVRSFGSSWGRIQPDGETRELFFNQPSLIEPVNFDTLKEGQRVDFEEQADSVNKTHAIRVAAATI
jgi:cold shock CspA family protein